MKKLFKFSSAKKLNVAGINIQVSHSSWVVPVVVPSVAVLMRGRPKQLMDPPDTLIHSAPLQPPLKSTTQLIRNHIH